MLNDVKCKYYDPINGWCEKLSNFGYPKHFEYCPKSPCEYAEPIEQPMNDNDIIKALGYCFAVGDCEHCVYADKPCQELLADALKLINRLKSEIEKLNHIRAELSKEIDKLREVNNDLNYQVNAWNPTQTIKDFAVYLCDGRVSNDPVVIAVKCAVKEMTEGEDDTEKEEAEAALAERMNE